MPCQLTADCLNEIFEYLEEDKITLRSCLLVNRLWCQVAVRILWMNVWSFQYRLYYSSYRTHVPLAILSTLFACLPNESKELLNTNGIFIPTPTSKPPLFNYASFCKVLPIRKIDYMVKNVLKNQLSITLQILCYKKYLVSQELLKMFMKQISSLRSLGFDKVPSEFPNFTYFPGAKVCLADLSVFSCDSNIRPDFFYQLSQICHNIQTFTISFISFISNGLANLISSQNNLKELNLSAYGAESWISIITSLTKHHGTLKKLHLDAYKGLPLFKELQNITFPRLEILEIEIPKQNRKPQPNSTSLNMSLDEEINFASQFDFDFDVGFDISSYIDFDIDPAELGIIEPRINKNAEYLLKFLENNGKNLKELTLDCIYKEFKLSIGQFCPNLKKIFVIFKNDELDVLKTIFNNCQYLESIQVWCSNPWLNEKGMLEVVAKYSPQDFYELKIYNYGQLSELLSEDLESFFISWKSRTPKKSLTLIIMKYEYEDYGLDTNEENMKIIEKYKELGIIKKFETRLFD